jgi:hypothetical protein
MPSSKDVELKGVKYRIGQMDAMTGGKILSLVLPKLIPYLDEKQGLNPAAIIQMLPSLGSDSLNEIQRDSMKVCSIYKGEGIVPIMMVDGRWANKEMEFDAVTVLALTCHAVIFNLAPFFSDGGLQMIMQSIMGTVTNQSPSQT